MFGTHDLALFIVYGLLLNMAPGSRRRTAHRNSTAFASRRLRVSGAVTRWLNRLIGAVFASFGIKLALQEQS